MKNHVEKFGPYTIPADTSELARDILLRLYKDGQVGFLYEEDHPSRQVAEELIIMCLGEDSSNNGFDTVDLEDAHHYLFLVDWNIYEPLRGQEASEEECLKKGPTNKEKQQTMPKELFDFLSQQNEEVKNKIQIWFDEEHTRRNEISKAIQTKGNHEKKEGSRSSATVRRRT